MTRVGFKTKLSNVALVVQGQSPESIYYSDFEGVPFLQGNRTFGILYPSFDTYTKKVTKLANKGDVLMSVRAPVGDLNFAPCDLCIGRGLAGLKAKTGNNKFLYYALKYNVGNLLKQGAATTFDSVNKDTINDFELIIPEDETHRNAVGSVLSAIDLKIEINNRINIELEQMAKTLYDYWFVQFDFPDENGKHYKTSGGKMVWNEELKREIPDGWEVDILKNHISIERGISYSGADLRDVGVPMVNLNSFYLDGRYKADGIKYYVGSVNPNKVIRPGELIIATTDVTRNAYVIGKSFILPDLYNSHVIASCDIAKVNIGNKLDKYFLNMLFNSDDYHRYIKGFASGTLVLHLDTKGIDWYKCLIPPKYLLNKYAELKANIDGKKTLTLKENKKLSELRDWLLPMLMNGQVKVMELVR
ncbi:MAG: restriction endonuclease subunit S [Candidatus Berkelbacteria bacterium]